MTRDSQKTVILLHGWLGGPRSFGDLATILDADGHRVLPVFKKYDTITRRLTLEDLADAFQIEFERHRKEADRPLVLIGHSMGGLLARFWMLRHFISKGDRPPVEQLVECASPRHGVPGDALGRLLLRLRLLPGSGLLAQMAAANSFLWRLNEAEVAHVELWPAVAALTSLLKPPPLWARLLAGGRESDGVVPAVLSNPNAVFVSRRSPVRRPPKRAFRVFPGWRHQGRRGLLGHIRAGPSGAPVDPNDAVCAALRELVRSGAAVGDMQHGESAKKTLRRVFIMVRQASVAARSAPPSVRLIVDDAEGAGDPPGVRAVSCPEPGCFVFEPPGSARAVPTRMRFALRRGQQKWTDEMLGLPQGLAPGEVCYVDLD
jgi:hypothetical protein